jgi:hypothetical protein
MLTEILCGDYQLLKVPRYLATRKGFSDIKSAVAEDKLVGGVNDDSNSAGDLKGDPCSNTEDGGVFANPVQVTLAF